MVSWAIAWIDDAVETEALAWLQELWIGTHIQGRQATIEYYIFRLNLSGRIVLEDHDILILRGWSHDYEVWYSKGWTLQKGYHHRYNHSLTLQETKGGTMYWLREWIGKFLYIPRPRPRPREAHAGAPRTGALELVATCSILDGPGAKGLSVSFFGDVGRTGDLIIGGGGARTDGFTLDALGPALLGAGDVGVMGDWGLLLLLEGRVPFTGALVLTDDGAPLEPCLEADNRKLSESKWSPFTYAFGSS
jgi:hypothetical protein